MLWLNDNQIQRLENLEFLTSLEQFQCGNNQIKRIDSAFKSNLALKDIMLSGNQIYSFREILHLVHLPNLTTLSLSDPNFEDNPISSLFNYQTHVILHLPKLQFLDSLQITEESRRIIGATVLKKIMYYNMRISTIRRNENILARTLANKVKQPQISNTEADIQLLLKFSQRITRFKHDATLGSDTSLLTASDKEDIGRLEEQVAGMKRYLERLLTEINTTYTNAVSKIRAQGDSTIQKLLLELETGGNIRFESGSGAAGWMRQCESMICDFVHRGEENWRVYLDSENAGISKGSGNSIRVHRMSLIHNRYLKNGVEEWITKYSKSLSGGKYFSLPEAQPTGSSILEDSDSFEYLLFIPESKGIEGNQEVFEVVENGFSSYYAESSFSEDPRRLQLSNYFDIESVGSSTPGISRYGIICKVFAPKMHRVASKRGEFDACVFIDKFLEFDLDRDPRNQSTGIQYITRGYSNPCYLYHPFSPMSVLPEYMIEFSHSVQDSQCDSLAEANILEIAQTCQISSPGIIVDDIPSYTTSSDVKSLVAEIEEKYPQICGRKIPSLEESVKSLRNNSASVAMEELDLSMSGYGGDNKSRAAISADFFSFLPTYRTIKRLFLSQMHLSLEAALDPLENMKNLELLDISFNYFKSIPRVVPLCSKLVVLILNTNSIEQIVDFSKLNGLVELDIRFNPCCLLKNHMELMGRKIGSLRILNTVEVVVCLSMFLFSCIQTREDISLDYVSEKVSAQEYLFRPLSVRTHDGPGSSAVFNRTLDPIRSLDLRDLGDITTLELDNCSLTSLDFLPSEMKQLKWASFRNNNLTSVAKLQGYPSLEELSLGGNSLQSLESLVRLPNLSRLDASNNEIEDFPHVANFPVLAYLSLEGNCVAQLHSFRGNPTLMELCMYAKHQHFLTFICRRGQQPRDGASLDIPAQGNAPFDHP